MLKIFFFLMAIITTVYSDCCETANLCSNEDDVNCHLKNYGIYCCNDDVKQSIALFANDSNKIVRLVVDCVVFDVCKLFF